MTRHQAPTIGTSIIGALFAVVVASAVVGAPASASTGVTAPVSRGGWGAPVIANPAHGGDALISCPSTTFCAQLDASGNVSRFDGSDWTTSQPVDQALYAGGGTPLAEAVSCASETFCVAIDTVDGASPSYAQVFDGATWTEPTSMDPHVVKGISCVRASFCVAVDGSGNAVTFDGSSWSAPVSVTSTASLLAVSCASSSWCLAVGGGQHAHDAFVYDAGSWAPSPGASKILLNHVSCVSDTWCMATGGRFAVELSGSTWARPEAIVPPKRHKKLTLITALSCASPTLCIAANYDRALVFDGSQWTYPARYTWFHIDTTTVACVSATWCMAGAKSEPTLSRLFGGDNDYAIGFDGTSWTPKHLLVRANSGLVSVSCPALDDCVGVSAHGSAVTRTNGAWGTPTRIDPAGGTVAVSCGSPTFCAAVSEYGYAEILDGDHWSPPQAVDLSQGLQSVSCVGSSFCMAVDDYDHSSTFDGSGWTHLAITSGFFVPEQVSCASSTFCMVVGLGSDGPAESTFDGSAWSQLTPVPLLATLSVSCTSSARCVAVGRDSAATWGRSGWSQPITIDPSADLDSVSCASTCEAVDQSGNAFRSSAGTWGPASTIDPRALASVSCAARTFCVAVDGAGFALTRGT